MVRKHVLALATTAFMGVSLLGALPAQALMYNFAYSGSGVSASGLLDVNGGLITNISGTYSSAGITGLISPTLFQGNDNVFNPGSPHLTVNGFSFDVAGLPANNHVNVFYHSGEFPGQGIPCDFCYVNLVGPDNQGSGSNTLTQVNFTASPVPLPAAVWLFGSGLIGLVGIGRRRRAA